MSHMGWAGDKPTKARVEKEARPKRESKYNPESNWEDQDIE